MADESSLADKIKDKSDKNDNEDMAEWERRLADGDLPEDFLAVTEPQGATSASPPVQASQVPATGLLVDIPTVEATNDAKEIQASSHQSLSKDVARETMNETKKPLSTEESDHALALKLQRQLDFEQDGGNGGGAQIPGGANSEAMMTVVPANVHGRLTVTVAEARLARNYGMSRMDPYCRLRIGHSVYETPTAANGAREPKWNKTFHVYLLKGTKTIDVEIYDECTFTNDVMVAHSTLPIPDDVFKHVVVDEWFPLSGQEGHEKEGVLHLILSLQPIRQTHGQPMVTPAQGQAQPKIPTEEQLTDLNKMFPNLDKDIIKTVFMEKGGHQEEIVNVLLQMSSD